MFANLVAPSPGAYTTRYARPFELALSDAPEPLHRLVHSPMPPETALRSSFEIRLYAFAHPRLLRPLQHPRIPTFTLAYQYRVHGL
jgi:hypothetical protein